MQLPEAFDTFHDRVSLGAKPRAKIESATTGVANHLTGAYQLPAGGVFLQGSYPNGTAVEPAAGNGDYDADLVAVCASADAPPDDALKELEDVLCENATYAQLIEKAGSRKKPCVRLQYADDEVGGFHVDVVPARGSTSADPDARLEVPRRSDGWYDTAPIGYTQWCASQGERFARTVRMLKRWRQVHQPARQNIKSIVLQVLAANAVGTQASDAVALAYTLEAIKAVLDGSPDGAPRIENPVLPSEDLGARWTLDAYRNFRKELDEAVVLASAALGSANDAESHELWQRLLGDDFPAAPSEPAKRVRVTPAVPPPGFENTTQAPPRRERYGA